MNVYHKIVTFNGRATENERGHEWFPQPIVMDRRVMRKKRESEWETQPFIMDEKLTKEDVIIGFFYNGFTAKRGIRELDGWLDILTTDGRKKRDGTGDMNVFCAILYSMHERRERRKRK